MFRNFKSNIISAILVVSGILCFVHCKGDNSNNSNLFFISSENTFDSTNSCVIILSWKEISRELNNADYKKLIIEYLNNGKIIQPLIFDIDSDSKPDYVEFDIRLKEKESLLPFEIKLTDTGVYNKLKKRPLSLFNGKITRLVPATDYLKNHDIKSWPKTIANSVIATYPNPRNLDTTKSFEWNYTNGFMINALTELFRKTADSNYLKYATSWTDLFVSDSGVIDSAKYNKCKCELDDILPGRSLINLYYETGRKKYMLAAEELIESLKYFPRTKDNGFWHKKVYKNQMWLDGVYMADVFLLQYGNAFQKTDYTEEGIHQIFTVYNHTCDRNTGLLYHGWDESFNKVWANPKTGTSPEFWGRGIGWYLMSLVDGIQYLSNDNAVRDSVAAIFRNLSASVLRYQDKETGLWYQVVDKGNREGNWIETSASAMFAYAFEKGYKTGILDKSYSEAAKKAFDGLVYNYLYFDNEGKIYLTGTVKVGTLNFKYSNGSYEYYTSVDRRVNDFKGLAALLYLTMELEFEK